MEDTERISNQIGAKATSEHQPNWETGARLLQAFGEMLYRQNLIPQNATPTLDTPAVQQLLSRMKFSIREAANLLQVDEKTVSNRLDKADISPEIDPLDKRRSLITGEQLVALAKSSDGRNEGINEIDPDDKLPQFNLQQSADVLGIDLKTLRKRISVLGIQPTVNLEDRRQMLLSSSQIAFIAQMSQRRAVI